MIDQAPFSGARDLLPLEVAQKSWINDCIQNVFQRWGYKRIVTSSIEWMDTLMAGGAIQSSQVIQLQDLSDSRMGLRPELTASIARAAVTRLDITTLQRLCYRANVFRKPPKNHLGSALEFYQAGVELLFAGGIMVDAEILLLLSNCLDTLGLNNWQLLLGEASLTQSLLSPFSVKERKQVRNCLAKLDRLGLEGLSLSPLLKERALFIFDLRGNPTDVLTKVMNLDLDKLAIESVKNLQSLIELVSQSSNKPLPMILDLSLIQTFDYYTGIIFDVVSYHNGKFHLLGQGGRYDKLLGVYHPQGKTSQGIGFSLNIEDLHTCLLDTSQLPQSTPPSDWLVIPQDSSAKAAAFVYAQNLRNTPDITRVELDLQQRSKEEALNYAQSQQITNVVWIQSDGKPIDLKI